MDKNKLIISAAVVLMASTGIVLAANSGNSSHVTLSGLADSVTYTLKVNTPLYSGSSQSGVGTAFVKTGSGADVKFEYNKLSPFECNPGQPFQTGFNSITYGSYIDVVDNDDIKGIAGISRVTIKCVDTHNSSMLRVHYGWEPGVFMNFQEQVCSPFDSDGIYNFDLPNSPSYIRIDSDYLNEPRDYAIGINEISIKYSCVAPADPYVSKGYVLNLETDHFEVKRYKGTETELVFPSEYEGVTVTAVANDFSVDIGKDKITSVELPSSITRIGENAFKGASKLETINLESVRTIEYRAFFNCSKLGSTGKLDIYAPTIGEGAFIQSGVTNVALHSSTGTITTADKVFRNCFSLETVLFDNDLTLNIGSSLFDSCSSLTTIRLPITLNDNGSQPTNNSLNKTMFYECSSLSDIEYAGTIEQWGNLYKPGWWSKDIPQSTTQVYCIASDAYTNLGRKDNG